MQGIAGRILRIVVATWLLRSDVGLPAPVHGACRRASGRQQQDEKQHCRECSGSSTNRPMWLECSHPLRLRWTRQAVNHKRLLSHYLIVGSLVAQKLLVSVFAQTDLPCEGSETRRPMACCESEPRLPAEFGNW